MAAAGDRCTSCGREVDEHDRHVRFRLPVPVLEHPGQDAAAGAWQDGPDATSSVMLQVPGVGAFVRALLPVTLTGGHRVTYGVWVSVRPDDLQRAFRLWWAPEYVDLRLAGVLASAVQPWEVYGAPVELAVLDPDHTPYCVASSSDRLARLLGDEWDHDLVLSTLP